MKTVLVVLALILVITGILAAVGLGYRALVISRQFQPAQLIQLDKQLVNEIAMSFRGFPPVLLTRNSDKWRITVPITGAADTQNTLITRETLFEMQIQRRYSAKDADRPSDEESGINQPRALVRLRTENGESIEFAILNFVPRRKETYIAIKGSDELLCVSPDPTGIIDKPFGHYRDKKLLELTKKDFDSVIEITARGRSEFKINRYSDRWVFNNTNAKVDNYLARPEAVTGLLNSLIAIDICGFLPQGVTDPAQFDMDPPWQSYRLAFDANSGREPLDIALIMHAGAMYASINGEMWPVQIRAEYGRATIREIDSMLDRQLFSFAAADIAELTIASDGKTLQFRRDGQKWLAGGGEIDSVRFEKTLGTLAGIKFESVISDYASLNGFGLESPQMSADIILSDGRNMSLYCGSNSPTAGRIYLKCSDRESVFTVDSGIINELRAMAGN